MNKKFVMCIILAIIMIAVVIVVFKVVSKKSEKEATKTDEITTETSINNTDEINNTNNENNTENEEENVLNESEQSQTKKEEEENMYSTGTHHATIVVKDYGTIKVELYADIAPITVANFAKLTNEGFYNGLTFHRIISGFMIQGGDPLGNGTGGSDENIKGEFSVNGVKNELSHTRGVLSMARATPFDSASSQFFIMHEDGTYLDGQYAAFGKVTSGMDVVDKICQKVQVEDGNGTVLKSNQPVIEKITMDD